MEGNPRPVRGEGCAGHLRDDDPIEEGGGVAQHWYCFQGSVCSSFSLVIIKEIGL